jgi:hypothetical protein
MRRTLFVFGFATALLATPVARAAQHELYLASGGGYFSSPARLVAGYGGGPGYRVHLTESVSVHSELRWLGFLGNAVSISAGATYAWQRGGWQPAAGLQLTGWVGDQVRIVTADAPDPALPLAVSMQARLQPLRFTRGAFCTSALSVDVGAGVERKHAALALLFSLLEIGYRF